VVEDDDELRRLVVDLLGRHGFEVQGASDGLAALERLAWSRQPGAVRWEPDVVITDLRMPKLDGMELVTALREASMPASVVVITAFGDLATRRRARALGAFAVLDKPFELDELLSLARRAADRSTRDGGGGSSNDDVSRRGRGREDRQDA
jgi:DNA-binding response OmpR family regulator